MNLSEYARHDGLGLAELVRAREVTPAELAALAVEAIDRLNPRLNAVLEVYRDRVARAGELAGPLEAPFHGVPFLLKDLGAAEAGQTQEGGSRLSRGQVVERETFLARRFKRAGLVILGRTAVPEYGGAFTTESALTGPTHNPWNLERTPGGSSGGAAAAVAAGVVPLAHANDSGGSIRVPAASCGLVGLKPSRGRVSLGPGEDDGGHGLWQELVVSRTVRDTAAALDQAAGPEPGDPFVIVQPVRPFSEEIGRPANGLRLAFTTEAWAGAFVDPEVAETVRGVARECEALGMQVAEASPRFDTEMYARASWVIFAAGLVPMADDLSERLGRPVPEHLEPVTLAYYRWGKELTAGDYVEALAGLNGMRRQVGAFFEQFDLLLSPTISTPPPPLGWLSTALDISRAEWERRCLAFASHTDLFNSTGQPAISLPLGQHSTGLPLGVQFAARFGQEAALIRVASALEQAMPWKGRLPPNHVSRG